MSNCRSRLNLSRYIRFRTRGQNCPRVLFVLSHYCSRRSNRFPLGGAALTHTDVAHRAAATVISLLAIVSNRSMPVPSLRH